MYRLIATASLCLAVTAAIAFSPAGGADDPPTEPKRLTNDELVKMLTKLGYEPKVLDKNYTEIKLERTGWWSVIRLYIGPAGTYVWTDVYLVTISYPEVVPAETWRKLLAKNTDIHPATFMLGKASKRLYLLNALPNADLTPAQLRKHLEALDLLVQETQPLWKLSNIVPPVTADGRKQLASLEGKWKVVELNDFGVQLTAEEAAKYAHTFDKDKFEMFKGGVLIRTGQLVAASEGGTTQLDRYSSDLTLHGIYKLEGDTLTWCCSTQGRPTKFAGDAKTFTSLYVMKREK